MLSYHVLEVNEGVIDGHNLDAFLKAGSQNQAANAAKAADGQKKWVSNTTRSTWVTKNSVSLQRSYTSLQKRAHIVNLVLHRLNII